MTIFKINVSSDILSTHSKINPGKRNGRPGPGHDGRYVRGRYGLHHPIPKDTRGASSVPVRPMGRKIIFRGLRAGLPQPTKENEKKCACLKHFQRHVKYPHAL